MCLFRNYFFIILQLLILSLIAYFNVGNPNLWYDESGQFWMSQGLGHFSDPLLPRGTFVDVIQANGRLNLDPGIFTVLLYFWTYLGTNPLYLRILPFIFFLLSILCLYKIFCFFKVRRYLALTCACSLLILLQNAFVNYAFEIRAYSMAYCGVFFCIYMMLRYVSSWDVKFLYIMASATLFFGLSRYGTAFLLCEIIGITVAYALFQRKLSLKKLFLTFLPLFVLIFIVVITLLNTRHGTPEYINSIMLSGKTYTQAWIIIKQCFPPYLVFLGVVYIISVLFCLRMKKLYASVIPLFVIFLVSNFSFFMFSCLGKYTWGLTSRWSIDLLALWITCFAFGISYLFKAIYVENCFCIKFNFFSKNCLPMGITLILLITQVFFVLTDKRKYFQNDYLYEFFSSNTHLLYDKKILISFNAKPTLKYIFEHTDLKRHNSLYRNMNFADKSYATLACDGYDFIIYSHMSIQIDGPHEMIFSRKHSGIARCTR